MLHTFARGLLALLAPPRCPGCDLPCFELGPSFCEACEPLLERAPESLAPPARDAAGYLYAGPLADAIRRLKYGADTTGAPALGGLLAEHALPYAHRFDVIVPLPQHARKLRLRGYNPASLLCRPLARTLHVPMSTRLLRRVRYLRDQAGLGRAERLENVRGAFVAHPRAVGLRILLVDDVRTTGATLAEASACLRAAGAEVHTLALACAEP